jgi:hypothetical protein
MTDRITITTYPPTQDHEVLGLVFGHGAVKGPEGVFARDPNPQAALDLCEQELRARAMALGADQVCGTTVTFTGDVDAGYSFRASGTAIRTL